MLFRFLAVLSLTMVLACRQPPAPAPYIPPVGPDEVVVKNPKTPRPLVPDPARPGAPMYPASIYAAGEYPEIDPTVKPIVKLLANWKKFQWYFDENAAANPGGINMPWAWAIARGDPAREATIGVADGGILLSEPYLKGAPSCKSRYLDVQDFAKTPPKEPGHGTFVMALMARCIEKGPDILAGVDWHSRILPIQYDLEKDSPKRLNSEELARSIEQIGTIELPEGAPKIINFSLGSDLNSESDLQFAKTSMDSVRTANNNGRILVIASGNEAKDGWADSPGGLPGVIAVGATTQQGEAAKFSNFRSPTIMAPGAAIAIDPIPGKAAIGLHSGTSFSSPITAALINLMWTTWPAADKSFFSHKAVAHILKQTAFPMTCKAYCPDSYDSARPGATKACRDLCCKKDTSGKPMMDTQNTCTAGLLNAYEAVYQAQKGLPNVPLIDAAAYFVELDRNFPDANLGLLNVGGKLGKFSIEIADPAQIEVSPKEFEIDYGERRAIRIRSKVRKPGFTKILIKTEPYDANDPKSDSLRIYVRTLS